MYRRQNILRTMFGPRDDSLLYYVLIIYLLSGGSFNVVAYFLLKTRFCSLFKEMYWLL